MPPGSTYRVQLRAEFGFADVAALADYFAALGVTHVYCSPILQATPGSTHGYDVVDHSRISVDLGGEGGFREMAATLRAHGIGLVVDVVPNHMAADPQRNVAWEAVLAGGPGSAYARWFDIDWDAQDGRVLLAILGEPAADAPLRVDGGQVRYHEHRVPDSPYHRLAFWRVAADELNYRRFFDVTSLVAIRVEDPEVFAASHELLVRLVREGLVDGLRIDHPDGLADPGGYLDRLAAATGGAWVVVEKILEPGEELPEAWACAGGTGYDALRRLTGVFLDPAGERPLTDLHSALTGAPAGFAPVAAAAKAQVVREVLGAEVNRLVRMADRIGRAQGRDLTRRGLREGLEALLIGFDVYRDYRAGARLAAAVERAVAARPAREREIRFLAGLAGLAGAAGRPVADPEFAVRFQQTCGPVMAKGVEDTAFYRWFRLTAQNEVGGDPGGFALPVEQFHRDNAVQAADWPAAMTTLSTHDTKRSEDVRARLSVLAELPSEWGESVIRWRARRHFAVDPSLEYLFWQTLVGGWPLPAGRMVDYLRKASREAKVHTSWTDPDPAYDTALDGFVAGVYADPELLADVADFVARIRPAAVTTLLGQKLLQLALPGVPDVYQGSECEDLSLVDPDNRRPVDYPRRRTLLARLDAGWVPDLRPAAADAADGVDGVDGAKLLVVSRVLRWRRDHPGEFARYAPVTATGPAAEHAVGFARSDRLVALATRLPVGLARRGGWGTTALDLPAGEWTDLLTGAAYVPPIPLAELLDRLPVALLTRAP